MSYIGTYWYHEKNGVIEYVISENLFVDIYTFQKIWARCAFGFEPSTGAIQVPKKYLKSRGYPTYEENN